MPSKILKWINERWPLNAVLRWSLEEEMPGGTSYAYIFGSCVLIVFLFQVITGVWQLLYFVPTTDRAYNSLNYLRREIPFGWLIHGLHYWGASAMIILVGLHLSQVFIWGAYKNPRQLTWLIGVGNLLLTLALGFTGPILPWDERGYWEAEVAVSSAGTAPFLGTVARNLLAGGTALGQMTVSRFFFLHVAILPVTLIAFVILHLVAFRKFGISGPWDETKRKRIGLFWPDQVFKDGVVVTIIFVALIGLSAYRPPPYSGPLDVLETFYVPKPEWYFLFFYQSLKAFHGVLEPIGTVGIPLVITLLLVFLPFYDFSRERNPARRTPAMVCYALFVTWVITMAIIGYYSKPEVSASGTQATQATQTASSSPGDPSLQSLEGAKRGAQLVASLGCTACHRVNGQGGVIGPEFTSALLEGKSRQWLNTQIRNPKAHFPNSIMPAFTSATDQQVNDIVDFLSAIAQGKSVPPAQLATGPPASPAPPELPKKTTSMPAAAPGPHGPPGEASFAIGNVELGATIFQQSCESCHGTQGKGNILNPGSADGTVPPLNRIAQALFNENAQTFVNNIDPYIQHGSIPEGPNPVLHMLSFGDSESLTQQMIANVEAYVLHMNGVDRAQLVHPGVEPPLFFWLVVVLFFIALASSWAWGAKEESD
ncbi:MAG TPA: cytochrome b N-terminal domain-containing protein [Thermodesulfobacteriota bacterium]|nr:cytochrome b N-terminal domain-containing protein [Thermodesulfobacteriota bacterium]